MVRGGKKKQIIALCLSGIMLLMMILSVFYIAQHEKHHYEEYCGGDFHYYKGQNETHNYANNKSKAYNCASNESKKHHGKETECPICRMIYRCENNLRHWADVFLAIIFGILIMIGVESVRKSPMLILAFSSLITQKVRMDN